MKILIIEDEYSLADAIAEALKKENFTTNIITDGEEGENEALTNVYDLILLDIMLPNKDGFKILNDLRTEKIDAPIIILTVKSEINDKLNGLENGADDYITKPFHIKELVARVKVVLKRKVNIENTDILEYDDLKLDIRTGTMSANENEISIKGKSGSGKTTLLSLITGLEKCTDGKVLYDGKDLKKMNLDTYRNTDIGIVFQSYNLLPSLTAIENIVLSMDISKVKVNNKKEKALSLMKSVGLSEDQAKRKILKLSGGEQQRIAIARSLSYEPKIIIADEPTGNLDKDTENDILNIFENLAKNENKCIIIVTHSQNVCDRADIAYELKK